MRFSFLFFSALFALTFVSAAAFADDDSFKQEHGAFFHLYNTKKDDAGIDYTSISGQEEDKGPGKYDLSILNLQGELPAPVGKDFFLLFGGQFGMRDYDFDRVAGARTAADDDTFYKIVGSTGFGQFLSEDLLLLVRGSYGTYSDFDDGFDENSLIPVGDARVIFQLNPGAQLLFGLRYSQDFDDTPLFPVAGVRLMNETGNLRVSLTLPLDGEVKYAFAPEVMVYLRGSVLGEQYRINSGADVSDFNVSVRDQFFGFGTEFWFSNTIKIGAEMGYSIGSQLDYKTRNSGQFDGDLNEALYLKASLGVNL